MFPPGGGATAPSGTRPATAPDWGRGPDAAGPSVADPSCPILSPPLPSGLRLERLERLRQLPRLRRLKRVVRLGRPALARRGGSGPVPPHCPVTVDAPVSPPVAATAVRPHRGLARPRPRPPACHCPAASRLVPWSAPGPAPPATARPGLHPSVTVAVRDYRLERLERLERPVRDPAAPVGPSPAAPAPG